MAQPPGLAKPIARLSPAGRGPDPVDNADRRS